MAHRDGDLADSFGEGVSDEERAWTENAVRFLSRVFHAAATEADPAVHLGDADNVFAAALAEGVSGLVSRVKKYGQTCAEQGTQEAGAHVTDVAAKALQTEQCIQHYFHERLEAEKPCPPSPPPECEGFSHGVHRRALDECLPDLVRDMRVMETGLLDKLVSAEVVSTRRADSIKGFKTSDLNRSIVKIARCLSQKRFENIFLQALKEEGGNALLASKLEATMGRLDEEMSSESERECKICHLRNLIDLRLLSDELRKHRFIDHDLYEDLRSEKLESKEAWRRVLQRAGHTQKMRPILETKYPDVWEEMDTRGITTLECKCLGFGFCSPQLKSSDPSTATSSMEKEIVKVLEDPFESPSSAEKNVDFSLMNNAADMEEGLESVGSQRGSSVALQWEAMSSA